MSTRTHAILVPQMSAIVDFIDGAFVRLVGTLLLEQNDESLIQRRYMRLETLAVMRDNRSRRLPAIAA